MSASSNSSSSTIKMRVGNVRDNTDIRVDNTAGLISYSPIEAPWISLLLHHVPMPICEPRNKLEGRPPTYGTWGSFRLQTATCVAGHVFTAGSDSLSRRMFSRGMGLLSPPSG